MTSNVTRTQTISIHDKKLEILAKELMDNCESFDESSDTILMCALRNSLSGTDINTILFGSVLRQYFSQHSTLLYTAYYKCVDDIMKSVYEISDKFFIQHHSSKEIFTFINNNVIQMLTNIQNVSYYMKQFDDMFSKYESLTTYLNMNIMMTYFIDKLLTNEKTLLQIMDENLMERDLNCFTTLSHFIECINYCYIHNIIDNPLKYLCQLTNTRTLFFKLLNKFPDTVINNMFQLFGRETSFTRDYKGFLTKRLLGKMTSEFIEREKQLLMKYTQYDPNGQKYIEEMKSQIDDVQKSIQLTQIFKNFNIVRMISDKDQDSKISLPRNCTTNTINLHKSLQFIKNIDTVVIDPSICNILVRKKDIWDVRMPIDTPKYNSCIDVYNHIFQKVYTFLGNNDTIVLDNVDSTGVLNISFDGTEYKFLATLSQINVLTTIIDNPNLTLDGIVSMTQYCRENVSLILDGLCTCELVICNDDKTFIINKDFFFEETNMSLISLLKFDEKFDEELIFDVLHIIVQNSGTSLPRGCTVQKISDEYEKQHGISNYDTIDSVVTHLIRGNIITWDKNTPEQILFNNQEFEKMKQLISL
jgi:hypothetical protein